MPCEMFGGRTQSVGSARVSVQLSKGRGVLKRVMRAYEIIPLRSEFPDRLDRFPEAVMTRKLLQPQAVDDESLQFRFRTLLVRLEPVLGHTDNRGRRRKIDVAGKGAVHGYGHGRDIAQVAHLPIDTKPRPPE